MINLRGSNKVSRRRALAAIGAPALAAAAGTAWWMFMQHDDLASVGRLSISRAGRKAQPSAAWVPSRVDVRREAAKRTLPELDWAEAKTLERIDECLRPVSAFFDDAKDRLPLFAEDALNWTSERYLVADYVWPWSSGDWQQQYLQQRWEKHVFSSEDLANVLKRAAQAYADATDEIEQEMLIRMRLDVEDLRRDALPEFAGEQRLAKEFRGAIDAAVKDAQADVGRQIELFVAAEIAERVLARVVTQLAPKAGLLGAGAAASPYSFGLSLLAALVISYLLDLVWDWWADPQGKLVEEIGGQLDRLRRLIGEGDGVTPGLRGEFDKYARQRARLRAAATATLFVSNKALERRTRCSACKR